MPSLTASEYFQTNGGVSDPPSGFLRHATMCKGPSGFSSHTTAAQVLANWSGVLPDGTPKLFIVTGASGGLGLESAVQLAAKGAEVVIAARSKSKADEALAQLKANHPGAKASTMLLDLASLKSVREFAAEFKASGKPLHGLILNAGVMFCPFSLSADGHELQFATNHLGHFLLVQLLLDTLLDTAARAGIHGRIVSVSSMGHQLYRYKGDIRFEDIDSPEGYDPEKAYGQSKLCNILLARQLNVMLQGKPIIAVACHPGVIGETELARHMKGVLRWALDSGLFRFLLKSTAQGAATQVYCATGESVVGGEYYVDCNLAPSSVPSHSRELARKLWELSERLCA